jgi:hypothetical protein
MINNKNIKKPCFYRKSNPKYEKKEIGGRVEILTNALQAVPKIATSPADSPRAAKRVKTTPRTDLLKAGRFFIKKFLN